MEVGHFINLISEKIAPFSLAESWDNVGLQMGNTQSKVKGVVTCLDVTKSSLKYALTKNANLILSHHPLFFHPLKKMDSQHPKYFLLKTIFDHDLTVASFHTNLDKAYPTLSDNYAQKLGLKNVAPIRPEKDYYFKFVIFVPHSHAEKVRSAIFTAGGGGVGNYSQCSYNIDGIGTFCPLEGSNPYLGSRGRREEVCEIRMEFRIPKQLLSCIVEAAKNAHPYEEMAYDVYPLKSFSEKEGLGRFGELSKKVSVKAFLNHVKKIWELKQIRGAFGLPTVKKVGICTGSGSSLIQEALSQGIDTFITGDLKYHDVQGAIEGHYNLIELDHFTSEKEYANFLAQVLKKIIDVPVFSFTEKKSPWRVV
ncbi:MAG: Nif3-like dinuclear metal center hexameric protein [Deltaproteobacteria bacterium]|nr:Nif3-like dinuclear metal center hexameric protein [Deltaproteobacteria bacterium]